MFDNLKNEKITVLVVDDSPTAVWQIGEILERNDYSVITANDGIEAVASVKKNEPAIVLLDIYLPEIDGFEALKQIKEFDNKIITIMMTARGSEETAIGALRGGADDYIMKPVIEPDLIKAINNCLEKKRLQLENLRLINELKESNIRLQKINQYKSEFLANTSHELRTPLNSIIGFSEILTDEIYGKINDKQREQIEIINDNGRILLRLINSLLDFSKIESGKMTCYFKEIKILEFTQKIMKSIKVLAKNRKIDFILDIDPKITAITADQNKLEQILINLLSNAIKFIKESGMIKLDIKELDKHYQFCIEDTGIGIKKDDINIIFEAFRQLDSSASKEYMGTGLGLSLTKKLVELHGGKIWCDSEYGKGSKFYFMFPKTLKPSTPAQNILNEPPKKTILLIDDNAQSVELLSVFLKKNNYDVVIAYNGEMAVSMAINTKPYAILLDIVLPGKSGWEVLSELKQDTLTRDIPVIICSMVDDFDTGYKLGATEYIVKPIEKEYLLTRLESLAKTINIKDRKPKILIIDDDRMCVDLLELQIDKNDFSVVKAYNGNSGISKVDKELPDIVILDLMMPDISGLDVLHYIRNKSFIKNAPVIILTAKYLTDEEIEYLNNNSAKIMMKATYDKNELLDELSQSLKFIENQNK